MYTYRTTLLTLGDIGSFIIGFFCFIALVFPLNLFWQQVNIHAPSLLLLTILWIGIFYVFNFYDIQKSRPNVIFLKNFGIAATIMLGIGFAFFYLNPITAIAPKSNLLIFLGISLVIVLAWRRLFYLLTRSAIHTYVTIISNSSAGKDLADIFKNHPELGFACCDIYSEFPDASNIDPMTTLVIVDTRNQENNLSPLFASHREVIDITEAYERIMYKIPVSLVTDDWVIHSIKKTNNFLYELLQRILGIIVATIITIITLPITLVTALAIKFHDGGPIFYSQLRTGLRGKSFKLYKFRSMIVESETRGAQWADTNDNRITPIGKIIRKLHIDEIPQMWNIFNGDIGLVGPRAERPEFVAELEQQIPYYIMRHTVRPGFTGWAQIKFRYARSIADSQEKFEYDLYYIKNRNIFMDLGIIIKTVQIIFTH